MFSGCHKDLYNPDDEVSLSASELFEDSTVVISSDFDWSITNDVNLTVKVDDQYAGQYYYTVEVFDSNPVINSDATLYSKGVANINQDYKATETIPKTDIASDTTVSYLYIRQTDPSGLSSVKMAEITGSNILVNFGTETSVKSASFNTKAIGTSAIDYSGIIKEYPTPNPTLLTKLTNTLGTTLSLLTGTNYIIPAGETYSGSITFPYTDSYLYIEGTWENTSANVSTNGWKIIVQDGGKITSTKTAALNVNNSSILFIANGGTFDGPDISITQTNETGNEIVNLGEMENYSMNSVIGLYNYGELTISEYLKTNSYNAVVLNEGTLNINNGNNNKTSLQGTFENYGTVTMTGDLYSKTSTFSLINNGSIEINQLDIQGTIQNNCKFIVDDTAELNSPSTLNVATGGIFETNSLTMGRTTINLESDAILNVTAELYFKNSGSSYIYGPSTGNYALARLYKISIANWSKPTLSGYLEIESSDYPANEKQTSYYGGEDIKFVEEGESDLTIESTDCNNGGNNAADGEDPEDPEFPVVESSEDYTYLFEDLWPNFGDYDMNDLVMDIQPTYYKNSDNKIEKMTILITLRANGGALSLAGGIQLDNITSDEITSISRESDITLTGDVFQTENGLESGQQYAVLPIFDESHKAFGLSSTPLINTIDGGETSDTKTTLYTIEFSTPLESSDLSLSKFNVFIVNGGYTDSRDEIHLAGYSPTDKANTEKFGTHDDNSDNSLYKSNSNLIWGLAVPGPLSYPLEYTKITKAYPDFKNWATSSGTTNTDWYENPDSEFIY